MLTYHLEDRGTLPLYEYLYQCIRQDILNGHLKKDEKLPSKRSFAKHLDISVVTIETAYAQLQIEGYIYSKEKSGFFVSDIREMSLPVGTTISSLSAFTTGQTVSAPNGKHNHFCNTAGAYLASGSAGTLSDAPTQHYFADFQTNRIADDSFPFSVWSRLSREVLSDKEPELLKAQPSNGSARLREAISEYLYRFRGMQVVPEQIFIGAGTEYLYSLLVQLIGRDLVYAVEDPGHRKVAEILTSNGVHCEHIPLDAYGLSCKALAESTASVVHISPAHHFPTGIIMPIRRRQELLDWAYKQENRYIIEDDYDSEFRFQGRPIQPLQSIDTNDRVIYINTFSKSLTPSIRISYMVLPWTLVKRFHKSLSFYSCTVSGFEQYTLAAFISRGYYEQHINRMRNAYKTKRNLVIQALKNSPLAPVARIHEENSGLHFLLELQTDFTDDELIASAARCGIKITCLSKYYQTDDTRRQHTFILNYSGVENDRIPEAIERLAGIMK
ncbi:MAG: PLP-dependent aminotransferase family protein [Lachnospiraceae bacterium]|nr:PLP-dependent aminotransferase family protein [Lachnospiraceae bacterium]